MSDYKSAVQRINNATSTLDLARTWLGLVRVYELGHLTEKELQRLDANLCNRTDQLMRAIQ